jgi:ribonuclease Z
MQVVMLGTGSGKPTLKRNVSAVAVVWESEWILFDCGESTQIQLMKAGLSLSRLSGIFITHLHGDHFNGLPGLLSSIGLDGRTDALPVVGPPGIRPYLDLLRRLHVLGTGYWLDVREFGEESFCIADAATAAGASESRGSGDGSVNRDQSQLLPVFETDLYTVNTRPLDHRIYALGYRVEERAKPGRFNVEQARALGIPEGPLFGRLQSGKSITLPDGTTIHPSDVMGAPRPGRKVSYCTDTRPCRASVELSRQVNLMIHEATFAQGLEDKAAEYGHSTAGQAADIAVAAEPEKLMITHISARYQDASVLLQEARARFANTSLAEDLMAVEV